MTDKDVQMPIPRLRLLLLCVSLSSGIASGCLGVPPVPTDSTQAQAVHRSQSSSDDDPYEGWLFRKLTGQKQPAETTAPAQPVAVDPNPAYGSQSLPGSPITESVDAGAPADDGPDPKADDGLGPDDFYLENIVKNIKKATGQGPDKAKAQAAFDRGEALFREGKYEDAAGELSTAADRWPESAIEEDALFLLGECYFFTDQYFKAHDAYGKLLVNHTNTRHLDTVMNRTFAIARYWDEQQQKAGTWPITPNLTDKKRPRFDTFGHAIEAYQRIRLHDPTGPLADHAVMAMANGYFVRNQFENAAWNYDLLRKEYPDSEHQFEAHLLGLQAKRRIYQGSHYDGKALEEAEEIANQTLTMFPDKLGEEQKRLLRNQAQIVEEQALRDYAMGQFYEAKRCYGAARYYYKLVIEGFPNSQTAQRAQERIEAIRDKPNEPSNPLRWVTDLLPDEKG